MDVKYAGALPSPGARKSRRYVHVALILALLAASLFYYPQLWHYKVDRDAGRKFSWGEVSAAFLAQSNDANQRALFPLQIQASNGLIWYDCDDGFQCSKLSVSKSENGFVSTVQCSLGTAQLFQSKRNPSIYCPDSIPCCYTPNQYQIPRTRFDQPRRARWEWSRNGERQRKDASANLGGRF
jgi:hypothetical protein